MKEIHVQPSDDLQSVFDNAEEGSTVYLAAGEWRQKVMLTTPGLTIIGEGADKTTISYDDYAKKLDSIGREYNTFRTWTLAVCADNVTIRSLSVINDAQNPAEKGQEVALTVYGDAFTMEDCVLKSTQDTLFLGPLPKDLIERYDGFLPDILRQDRQLSQRFERCRFDGTVDFIFGCGNTVFTQCEFRSVYDSRGKGYVAAPAHAKSQEHGFIFDRCAFTCDDTVAPQSIYLARPWRDYGLVRLKDCTYGPHIAAAGFDPWLDSGRDKTARFYEEPAQPGRVAWANPKCIKATPPSIR